LRRKGENHVGYPQLPSYLSRENIGPWHIFLQQVEQVAPLLDQSLQPWVDTLRHPKRSLIVDVPIRLDNGGWRTSRATACITTPRAGRARAASASIRT
jgi:hypothetical protein